MGSVEYFEERRYLPGKIVSPRLEKLEKEFLAGGGEWKEFTICDLFQKVKTKVLPYKAGDLKNKNDEVYSLPALTAGLENQGLAYYVPRNNATVLKNVISVSANGANTGVMFYQPNEFTVLQDSYAIEYKDRILNSKEYLFILSALQKTIRFRFDWSNKAGWEKIKNEVIALPFLNGSIYFSYMEKYIEELEALRLEELEAYLVASGLKDYHLTQYDEEILDKFNKLSETSLDRQTDRQTDRLNRFILGDLFTAETGDVDLQQSDINGRGIYFINSGLQNNGIKGKTDKFAKTFSANTITVDFWGNAFYRNFDYKLATHNHVFSLSGMAIKNEQVGLYLVSAMRYLSKIYSYNDMGTWNKMKKREIEVPVVNGEIDYKFMEDFIYTIEKMVIKDVVLWADKKIEATNRAVGRN